MRTTASFQLFPDAPAERELARARWLAQEGRVDDALGAYRDVLHRQPDSRAAWAEAFELLRRSRRRDEALRWAEQAVAQSEGAAFARALEGAALIELARYPEALRALEGAIDADPDLAVVWHELGYAAYRLGEPSRALAALDRAFALEPHTATLLLRGRILLDAGRYVAAEVAFEGAAQAASFEEQRREAQQLIDVARRFGLFSTQQPSTLTPPRRFFADTGTVVLASASGQSDDDEVIAALATLAADLGWRFGQLLALDDPAPFRSLGERLEIEPEPLDHLNVARVPLVVARRLGEGDAARWTEVEQALEAGNAGLLFILEHPATHAPHADVVGRIPRILGACDPAAAVLQAGHPAARLAGRRLVTAAVHAAEDHRR